MWIGWQPFRTMPRKDAAYRLLRDDERDHQNVNAGACLSDHDPCSEPSFDYRIGVYTPTLPP